MCLFYSWKFLNAGGEIVLNPEREEAERLARLREALEERRFSREVEDRLRRFIRSHNQKLQGYGVDTRGVATSSRRLVLQVNSKNGKMGNIRNITSSFINQESIQTLLFLMGFVTGRSTHTTTRPTSA